MIKASGWWLPEGERHLVDWLSHPKNRDDIADGRTMYQGRKLKAALELCESFRTAVDCGAHCGTWSHYLAQRFAQLHSFEPVAEHQECFALNVAAQNVTLHACALGDRDGRIRIATTPGSSGDSHVAGDGDIPMRTLDSFNLQDVDFLKIDTEGFECSVLRGAEQTIRRCRPLMVVEQKPGHASKYFGIGDRDALPLLGGWGAVRLKELSGDFIYGWPD